MRHFAKRLLSTKRLPILYIRRQCTTESAISKPPSRVLHFSNLGQKINENDLKEFVRPFGSVSNIIKLRTLDQALLQMEDLQQANRIIQHYESKTPLLCGRELHIQYSSYQELTKCPPNQSKVIFVEIKNPVYQITVDILHRVFSTVGGIEKIVIFPLSGSQALIQYEKEEYAAEAMSLLQGRNIFNNCCQMDIGLSTDRELVVKVNNEFTRDYTKDTLPNASEEKSTSILGPGHVYATPDPRGCGIFPVGVNTGFIRERVLFISNLDAEKMDEDKLFNLFAPYGKIERIRRLFDKPGQALIQMTDGFQAELAMKYLQGATLFGKRMVISLSSHKYLRSPETRDYSLAKLNRFCVDFAKNCARPSKTIHIANLPIDVEEKEIIKLMSPHGSVVKVKIFDAMAKDTKQALVLFDSVEHATEALVCEQLSSIREYSVRLAFAKSALRND